MGSIYYRWLLRSLLQEDPHFFTVGYHFRQHPVMDNRSTKVSRISRQTEAAAQSVPQLFPYRFITIYDSQLRICHAGAFVVHSQKQAVKGGRWR